MLDLIEAPDFTLASTLECGQAFRWQRGEAGWFSGVVRNQVWRLRQQPAGVEYEVSPTDAPRDGAAAVQHYLSLDESLPSICATFPADRHLRAAIDAHHGLRVLRQEPWETLASFIASSSKQIVQIRQIVELLAQRFGEPINSGWGVAYAFPTASRIARCSHQELWDCKLGFRAKNLLAVAQAIDSGKMDIATLPRLEFDRALEELDRLPGVGEKIALCTLLFSCGFTQAFPIDVWVERSLRRLYFSRRKATAKQLRAFTRSYFGPHAGWAQQYLFYSERRRGLKARDEAAVLSS